MNLLQRMAAAAAKKLILEQLISQAPAAIKAQVQQLCADEATVNALQDMIKNNITFPLSAEVMASLNIPEKSKDVLAQEELVIYLRDSLQRFKKRRSE